MADRPGERSDGETEPTAAQAGGFLPPEAPGPEPELGAAPAAQPPPGWQQPPPAWQPPPPGWQPPAQQWPPPAPAPYPTAPAVPGNSQAVAGLVLSAVAAGLLVVSFGTSSILSIVLAVIGIVLSRKGRRNVEEGRTPKHGDLAKAGFISGIVALVLTVLVTAAWIVVIAVG